MLSRLARLLRFPAGLLALTVGLLYFGAYGTISYGAAQTIRAAAGGRSFVYLWFQESFGRFAGNESFFFVFLPAVVLTVLGVCLLRVWAFFAWAAGIATLIFTGGMIGEFALRYTSGEAVGARVARSVWEALGRWPSDAIVLLLMGISALAVGTALSARKKTVTAGAGGAASRLPSVGPSPDRPSRIGSRSLLGARTPFPGGGGKTGGETEKTPADAGGTESPGETAEIETPDAAGSTDDGNEAISKIESAATETDTVPDTTESIEDGPDPDENLSEILQEVREEQDGKSDAMGDDDGEKEKAPATPKPERPSRIGTKSAKSISSRIGKGSSRIGSRLGGTEEAGTEDAPQKTLAAPAALLAGVAGVGLAAFAVVLARGGEASAARIGAAAAGGLYCGGFALLLGGLSAGKNKAKRKLGIVGLAGGLVAVGILGTAFAMGGS